jgi:hypothetical protein
MNLSHPIVTKVVVGISLGIVACLIALTVKSRSDAGLKQLAADFRAANQAETMDPMLRLYCLEASDEISTTRLKAALQYELGLPIEKIKFEPLSGAPEETIQFTHNGTQYGPTLKPRYKMRVIYKGTDRFTSLFTIGKTDSGAWKFISTRPIQPPGN